MALPVTTFRINTPAMHFSGKRILITGGSRGIGRATAIAFAKEGARVAINFARNREAARDTIQAMPGAGHIAIKGNIASPNVARRVMDTVVRELGGIDVLVNNAGIYELHPVQELDYAAWLEQWQRHLQVNLTAAAQMCWLAARQMMQQGGGHIVNVSSRGAYRGEPEAPGYGAAKAGLNQLTQSLAQALAPHNIIVAGVAPGWVDTDMAAPHLHGPRGEEVRRQSPLGRAARPEEIAAAILFLASDEATYCTGAILDVNGASYLR